MILSCRLQMIDIFRLFLVILMVYKYIHGGILSLFHQINDFYMHRVSNSVRESDNYYQLYNKSIFCNIFDGTDNNIINNSL